MLYMHYILKKVAAGYNVIDTIYPRPTRNVETLGKAKSVIRARCLAKCRRYSRDVQSSVYVHSPLGTAHYEERFLYGQRIRSVEIARP